MRNHNSAWPVVCFIVASKIVDNLAIAHQYLARILENTKEQLVGEIRTVSRAAPEWGLRDYASRNLAALPNETAQEGGFDFLHIVGDDGHIIVSGYSMTSAV